jgi:hypothetical protein
MLSVNSALMRSPISAADQTALSSSRSQMNAPSPLMIQTRAGQVCAHRLSLSLFLLRIITFVGVDARPELAIMTAQWGIVQRQDSGLWIR